ncbi:hypothetical protein SAMN04488500_106302 [Sporomusa malonica]|uniref:Uncharacterized protein n=2 Tax=Sporomusa malonica TaxID=112901 RepID=A0A1W2B582_9FIRM|nr:hypothetical protein SAMN04488500_106302 [Sporomusa malonica]
MPLTREQKQHIYEEELERIKARKRIQAEQQPEPSRAMNWVCHSFFIYVLCGVWWR